MNNECIPSFHVSAYAYVVDDLTALSCCLPVLLVFMSLVYTCLKVTPFSSQVIVA